MLEKESQLEFIFVSEMTHVRRVLRGSNSFSGGNLRKYNCQCRLWRKLALNLYHSLIVKCPLASRKATVVAKLKVYARNPKCVSRHEGFIIMKSLFDKSSMFLQMHQHLVVFTISRNRGTSRRTQSCVSKD